MVTNLLAEESTFERKLGRVTSEAGRSLPYGYYAAAYGIAYAIQTSRVSAIVASAFEKMTDDLLSETMAEIVKAKLNIGDVPRWMATKILGP